MRQVVWDDGGGEWWGDLDPGPGGGDSDPPPPEGGPDALPPEGWDPPEPERGPTPLRPLPGDEEPDPLDSPGTEIIKIEEWRTARDDRVCPTCGPLDGTRWEEGDGPVPPAHAGCRCVRVVVATEERTAQRVPLPRDDGAWKRF